MNPVKILVLLIFIFLAGFYFQTGDGIGLSSAEGVILIVNKNVDQSRLSRQEVRDIFLGDKRTWDDGQHVVVVTLKSGTVHDEFLQEYIKKTAIIFSRYWKRMLMTGKSKIPIAFNSENDAIDYVKNTDGAIGYISPALLNESVKKMTID